MVAAAQLNNLNIGVTCVVLVGIKLCIGGANKQPTTPVILKQCAFEKKNCVMWMRGNAQQSFYSVCVKLEIFKYTSSSHRINCLTLIYVYQTPL